MPKYFYSAINQKGKKIKGIISAENISAAKNIVKQIGLYPKTIKPITSKWRLIYEDFIQKLKLQKEKKFALNFSRKLSMLLNAGFPLYDALTNLIEESTSCYVKQILVDIREKISEGNSLSKSLLPYKSIFPELYISLVEAGEHTGSLHKVLNEISILAERREKIINRIKSALTYPTFLSIFSIFIILYITTNLIPMIKNIFMEMKTPLPLPTLIVIKFAYYIGNYWFIWIGMVGIAIYLIRKKYSEAKGRKKIERLIMKIPIFGRLYRNAILSQIFLSLGTLIQSGIPIPKALEIVGSLLSNLTIKEIIKESKENVETGGYISEIFRKHSQIIPAFAIGLINIGEKTDRVGEMLIKSAESMEYELETTSQRITAIIEPIIIIIMGGIIGFIAISILLPIFKLNTIIGG